MQHTQALDGTRNDAFPALNRPLPTYTTHFARADAAVRDAQRLRYRVFVEEMGACAVSTEMGIEGDAFDARCEHLLIRHTATQQVVGTYRILTFDQAQRAGGFYSAREFDLRHLAGLSSRTIEVGRACVDPEHRNGVVLSLLWGGLFEFMRSVRCEYVIGCGSVSVVDDGRLSTAICNRLQRQHLGPSEWRVVPYRPFPLDPTVPDAAAALPPLLKGYLRLGAVVCGDPAWDPDFRTADFLLLLPVAAINARHADFLRRRVVRRIYA